MLSDVDFLKSDFEQCFQQLRYYDEIYYKYIRFLFSGYTAVLSASYALYISYKTNSEVVLGITGLLFLSAVIGTLFVALMIRNRVYFVYTARFINEIRNAYLSKQPLKVKNIAGMFDNPRYPKLFTYGSTQSITVYITICLNSLIICSALIALKKYLALSQKIGFIIPNYFFIIIFIIALSIQLIWIIIYLKTKEKTGHFSKAIFGIK